MITAKLKRIVPLEPNAQVDVTENGETKTFQLIEFQPGPSKRYMISVEIGQMPPREAWAYIAKVRDQLTKSGIFGENKFLVSPMRDGHPANGIYEIDIQ